MLASTRRLLASLSSQAWPMASSSDSSESQAWPLASNGESQAWPLASVGDSKESQAWPLASVGDSKECQAWPVASLDLAIVCRDGTIRSSCLILAAASPFLRATLGESEVLMLPWASTATVTEGLAALLIVSRPKLAPETTELLLNLGINSPEKVETEMIKVGQTGEVCGVIEGDGEASKTEEQLKSHRFNGVELHDEKCQQLQVSSDLNITNDGDLRERKEMENVDVMLSFICEHCNYKCTNQQTLLLHMEKEHDVESKIIVKCKEEGCNYATSSNKYLKSHNRRLHSGMKHLCNACGRAFGDKRELVSHNIAIHDEKNLPCSYCDKLYPSEKHRERHERLVHATELAYQCDECPQSYKHPSSLHKHKLSVHRGEAGKKFKCDQCDMAFITNGKLTHHKRSHTGEKHYACPYCGMGFIDPSAMSRHRKTHEGGAKFECDLCPKTYTQSYDVVKHKMAVHGVIIKSKRHHGNKEKKLKRYQKPGRFSEEVLGINLT